MGTGPVTINHDNVYPTQGYSYVEVKLDPENEGTVLINLKQAKDSDPEISYSTTNPDIRLIGTSEPEIFRAHDLGGEFTLNIEGNGGGDEVIIGNKPDEPIAQHQTNVTPVPWTAEDRADTITYIGYGEVDVKVPAPKANIPDKKNGFVVSLPFLPKLLNIIENSQGEVVTVPHLDPTGAHRALNRQNGYDMVFGLSFQKDVLVPPVAVTMTPVKEPKSTDS